MAKSKKKPVEVSEQHAKERIAYGIFVSVLGCLWLATEMHIGGLTTTAPIGPFIIIIIGFTMLLPWLHK
ncbi:MAG: hypothetical protein NTV88_03100 [Candidatus Micrarchaeota archaeon]|nr:hypothetical protein [Candidatus Micrarchaeota archaeon]